MALTNFQRLCLATRKSYFKLPPSRLTHLGGGMNLEIFKFGLYIMFPIGWMYYFGTNLESRFSVPDFWPAPETTHKLPFEKEELNEMAEQLKAERLERRRRRLEQTRVEMKEGGTDEVPRVEQIQGSEQAQQVAASKGTFGRGSIERWVRG